MKKRIQEEHHQKLKYARLECADCCEGYYCLVGIPWSTHVPEFLEEGECFSAECPLCESGSYAILISYLESERKRGF